jgi:aerobic carbon-monoxide dehydrogenase medium subunit
MDNFNFHRPATLDEAAKLLAAHKDGKFLAGGQSLLPVLKHELAKPTDLVSLAGLKELVGIREEADGVVIGALTTHADVANSALVNKAIPALAHLAHGIGDAQVRNRGTLGGSVAHADPSADYPAAILGLAASIKTNKRTLAADGFFKGMFETQLDAGEIVVEVKFKKPEKAGYMKIANAASKYALVGVMVAKYGAEVRVGITGARPVAFRFDAYEKALAARFAPEALDGIAFPEDDLIDERDARPAYRAHLVGVMTKRAVAAALKG